MKTTMAGVLGVLLWVGPASVAYAQDGMGGGGGESARSDEPVVLHASESVPDDPLGLGLEAGGMSRSGLIAEGTYLSRWTGRLVESAPDLWVIAFDSDANGETPGPVMAVLPGQRLVEMQQMVRDRNGDVTFRVGGHVTVFEGRNYFLPRVVTTVTRPPAEAANTGDVGTAASGDGDDPSVEALLKRVREAAPPTEVLLRTREVEEGEDRRLMSEGATILSVIGRAVRRDEGVIEFVPDNGIGSAPAVGAPVVLMPTLLTEEIASLVDDQGDRVRFSLSGEVFVYGGRNYLMPVLYRIEPRARVDSLRPAR
ncbi:MAG: hypothetical protein KDA30_07785 [Phycisphaerales bacterium]|nr:hypothetical protein [Phycisphaerales bacterium]